jgi:penicillin-binding protein 1A
MELQKEKKKKVIKLIWALAALPFVLLIISIFLVSIEAFGPMPTFDDLENPRSNLASEVISEDGELLGKFYIQNRTFVEFEELSPNLINALIAREDHRFAQHSGVDGWGLARVLFKTVLMGNTGSGGGSTISQQLAKNLFPRDSAKNNGFVVRKFKLFFSKIKENVTAVKLEKNYTKEEILVMYLNTVEFGSGTFGIKSASKTFFNKTPDSLKIEEAAVLVGAVKKPTKYNPALYPEQSLQRRNNVLEKMEQCGYIDKRELDSLMKIPINLHYQVQTHNEGPATYFREYLRLALTANEPKKVNYGSMIDKFKEDSIAWATDPLYGWCNKNHKPDGSPYNIYKDGIRIYTTINFKMQKYAEEAVREHLGKNLQPAFFREKKGRKKGAFSNDLSDADIKHTLELSMRRSERYRDMKNDGYSPEEIKKVFNTRVKMTVFTWKGERDTVMTPMDSIKYYKFFLRASFMSMDPHTGYVKAYVGGVNYKHFKYDGVIMQKRQVGSTFKPFIYTLAMQENISPCQLVPNVPTTFIVNDTVWSPKNSNDARQGQMVTLKWGLANSINYISAWVMKQFNPQSVIDVAHKMGITSYIPPVYSIVLGTADLSLYEMVSAYGTFANKGVHTFPIFVTRIEDKNGNVLSTFKPQSVEAISDETAYLMLTLLKGVITGGTGTRVRSTYQLLNPIAGKTGTTQNHSDGWFMGVTPDLVSGAWVGGEDRGIHFDGITLGQGASMALPIWALYMKKVYADKTLKLNTGDFERPVHFNVSLDCDKFDKQNKQESAESEILE